jgi:hypothetical protein
VTGLPHGLAVAYISGNRYWVAALEQALIMIDGTGNVTTLMSRTPPSPEYLFDQAHVAADGAYAFYTDGFSNVLYQINLATQAVTTLSMSSGGDRRLDPKAALSGVQFNKPSGLAFKSDHTLYLADRTGNVVFNLAPDSSGTIGLSSTVTASCC